MRLHQAEDAYWSQLNSLAACLAEASVAQNGRGQSSMQAFVSSLHADVARAAAAPNQVAPPPTARDGFKCARDV